MHSLLVERCLEASCCSGQAGDLGWKQIRLDPAERVRKCLADVETEAGII